MAHVYRVGDVLYGKDRLFAGGPRTAQVVSIESISAYPYNLLFDDRRLSEWSAHDLDQEFILLTTDIEKLVYGVKTT